MRNEAPKERRMLKTITIWTQKDANKSIGVAVKPFLPPEPSVKIAALGVQKKLNFASCFVHNFLFFLLLQGFLVSFVSYFFVTFAQIANEYLNTVIISIRGLQSIHS